MSNLNLHNLLIIDAENNHQPLENFSIKSSNSSFETFNVLFRNQEEELIKIINEFKNGAIFGCVAWLTAVPILKALSKCSNVQIIVQKEDFLRPDTSTRNINSWESNLRKLYNDVTCSLDRYQFKKPISELSICGEITVEGIRCVGNHNSNHQSAFPRSHHKFLVFCTLDKEIPNSWEPRYKAVGVWTGSFNLTKNATQSFENVLYFIDASGDNQIINFFLREHHQIFTISEQLDWEKSWSTPEFRIST